MARKVGFSGSRRFPGSKSWLVHQCITTEYRQYNGDVLFLVGDNPTGTDFIVRSFLDTSGWEYKEFFADWNTYGNAAGPIRNKEMIDFGASILYAFPDSDSKGTKQCAKYAHSKNIPVIFPELENWHKWAAPIGTLRE